MNKLYYNLGIILCAFLFPVALICGIFFDVVFDTPKTNAFLKGGWVGTIIFGCVLALIGIFIVGCLIF